MQTSLAMLHSASAHPKVAAPDPYGRTPFEHPALEGLEALNPKAKLDMTDWKKLAQIAEGYGLTGVIRWKPKQVGHQQRDLFGTRRADTDPSRLAIWMNQVCSWYSRKRCTQSWGLWRCRKVARLPTG